MAFSACVQSCLMSVVIKTTGVILLVVPRRLTLSLMPQLFVPRSTRAIESPKRGGHAWGGVKTGKGGLGCPSLLTMHFNQRSGL